MEHKYENGIVKCRLTLPNAEDVIEEALPPADGKESYTSVLGRLGNKAIKNIRNCDMFIEEFAFAIYVDVQLFGFESMHKLQTESENIIFDYDSTNRVLEWQLKYFEVPKGAAGNKLVDKNHVGPLPVQRFRRYWQMERITDKCLLRFDKADLGLTITASFPYGFGSLYQGNIASEFDIDTVSPMPKPNLISPVQRARQREMDELKHFSAKEYKGNFIDLKLAEGVEHPSVMNINFSDFGLNAAQSQLLNQLLEKVKMKDINPEKYRQKEVDNGLISILLAICYDVRVTANKPNAESAWTRSILSATLSYFEPFDRLYDVVISFLRRMLTYSKYPSFVLGLVCVDDAIMCFQKQPKWLLKQLLITHKLFETCDNERSVYNRYYLEDYIRYTFHCISNDVDHFKLLQMNIENSINGMTAPEMRLNLEDLEKEAFEELYKSLSLKRIDAKEDENDDENEDDDDDDNDYIEFEEYDEDGFDDMEDDENEDDANEEDYSFNEDDDKPSNGKNTDEKSLIIKRVRSMDKQLKNLQQSQMAQVFTTGNNKADNIFELYGKENNQQTRKRPSNSNKKPEIINVDVNWEDEVKQLLDINQCITGNLKQYDEVLNYINGKAKQTNDNAKQITDDDKLTSDDAEQNTDDAEQNTDDANPIICADEAKHISNDAENITEDGIKTNKTEEKPGVDSDKIEELNNNK